MASNVRGIRYHWLIIALTALGSVALGADFTGKVVTPDGKPVKDATVYLFTPPRGPMTSARPALPTTRTDENGDFHFPRSDPDTRAWFIAVADGFGLASAHPAAPAPFEIRLRPRTDLTLSLRTSDNKPIPNVTVELRQMNFPPSTAGGISNFLIPRFYLSPFAATSDASGNCSFPGFPQFGRAEFVVDDARFAALSNMNNSVQLSGNPQTTGRIVQLFASATISGKVRYDSTTRPAANVIVWTQSNDGGRRQAVTAGDGSYTLKRIAPGQYTVFPALGGDEANLLTATAIEKIHVAEGSATTGVDLALIPGVILNGRVIATDDGKPVPGVRIGIYGPSHPRAAGAMQVLNSDVNGAFTLRVPPGQQFVSIVSDPPAVGFTRPADDEKSVNIADGGTGAVEFRLPRSATLALVGKVVDPDGKPVAGASVNVSSEDQSILNTNSLQTGPDGTFQTAPMLRRGRTELRAKFQDMATPKALLVNGTPSGEIILQLQKNAMASISGRVVDTAGEPLKGARVELLTRTARNIFGQDSGLTDDQGNYKINSLWADGQYSVDTRRDGYGAARSEYIRVTAGQNLQMPDLKLFKRDANVAGVLMDANNNPVAGQRVFVRGSRTGGVNMTTGPDGKFQTSVVSNDDLTLYYNFSNNRSPMQRTAHPGDEGIVLRTSPAGRIARAQPAFVRTPPPRAAAVAAPPAPVEETAPIDPIEATWSGWLYAIIFIFIGGIVTTIVRAVAAIHRWSATKNISTN